MKRDDGQIQVLQFWQNNGLLFLILAFFISIGSFADLVRFKKKNLRKSFVGINPGWQRSRVRDLQRDKALPLRLERRDVDDDAAARIRGLADAQRQYIPRDAEIFDGPR